MAYKRFSTRIPKVVPDPNLDKFTKPDDVLAYVAADYDALVAVCKPGSMESVKRFGLNESAVFFENLMGFEEPQGADLSRICHFDFLASPPKNGDRVLSLVYPSGKIVPVKKVGSRYTPMQNHQVLDDAFRYLNEFRTQSSLEFVGSLHEDRVFVVQLGLSSINTKIGGTNLEFEQKACLFTSHDSTKAYNLAFSIRDTKSIYKSYWKVWRVIHTPGIDRGVKTIHESLLGLHAEGESFIDEVSWLGKIQLGDNQALLGKLIDFVTDYFVENGQYAYDRRSWKKSKVESYWAKNQIVYGSNAWAFYQTISDWTFERRYKTLGRSVDRDIVGLTAKHFEIHRDFKTLLINEGVSVQVK
jgi:hypothetical protein